MAVTIVNTIDEKIWRDFVDQHPQGNIFQTPEMFKVFARTKNYRPELHAAVSESGRILALLTPVQVTLRNGLFRRLTTRAIAYGSVLCAPEAEGSDALASLLQSYRLKARRDGLYSELRNLSDLSACQPLFARCGFAYQDHLNYLIDLDCSAEELFDRIGPRTRKHIRREANRGQIAIDQVNDPRQLCDWYEPIKKSYAAAKVPAADLSLFEAAFEVLSPRNMVKFWMARIGDDCIASSAELVYKDVVYGWYGGVDRAYSRFTPSEVLTWHILKWASESGFRQYDFGGAGSPEEEYGVRDFKAKFGGRMVCFGRNVCVHAPYLLRLSTLGYSVLRRFA